MKLLLLFSLRTKKVLFWVVQLILIDVFKHMNGVWIPEEEGTTKASFLSSKAVDCSVPRLGNTAVDTMDFTASEQPYARWEIKVPVHQSQGQGSVRGFT